VIVHLVTDRKRLGGGAEHVTAREPRVAALLAQIAAAVEAGVDVIQVRERDLEARALAALVDAAVARTRGSRTRVVVNDRLDVALACRADGVHLRGDSVSPGRVRRIAPPPFLVGRSVHSVADAIAQAPFVDYLIAGTVWTTASKPADRPLIGVDGLAAIARSVALPVLGIGGVTIERAGALARAGAAGVAAIGLFQPGDGAPVPLRETVDNLRRSFDLPGRGS
jgi:thiamine-phosphate pyrophosphorylase